MRVVFPDYRKAFALDDHKILADKSLSLHIPGGVATSSWKGVEESSAQVTDFSEWGPVQSDVP